MARCVHGCARYGLGVLGVGWSQVVSGVVTLVCLSPRPRLCAPVGGCTRVHVPLGGVCSLFARWCGVVVGAGVVWCGVVGGELWLLASFYIVCSVRCIPLFSLPI